MNWKPDISSTRPDKSKPSYRMHCASDRENAKARRSLLSFLLHSQHYRLGHNQRSEPKPYHLQLTRSSTGISSACLSTSCLAARLAPHSQVVLIGILITLVITQLYAGLPRTVPIKGCPSTASVAVLPCRQRPCQSSSSHVHQRYAALSHTSWDGANTAGPTKRMRDPRCHACTHDAGGWLQKQEYS